MKFLRKSETAEYLNSIINSLLKSGNNYFDEIEFNNLVECTNKIDNELLQLEYSLYIDDFYGVKDYCLKFKKSNWRLSDVNYYLEVFIDENCIKELFPELTFEELSAVLRVTTVFLNRFHCDARGELIRDEFFLSELRELSDQLIDTNKLVVDTKKFKKNFFKDSSHTDENIEAIEYIIFGSISNNNQRFGLKIKSKNIFLSDIILRFITYQKAYDFLLKEELKELTIKEYATSLQIISALLRGYECCQV